MRRLEKESGFLPRYGYGSVVSQEINRRRKQSSERVSGVANRVQSFFSPGILYLHGEPQQRGVQKLDRQAYHKERELAFEKALTDAGVELSSRAATVHDRASLQFFSTRVLSKDLQIYIYISH